VNTFVIEALKGKAQPRKSGMTRHRSTLEI